MKNLDAKATPGPLVASRSALREYILRPRAALTAAVLALLLMALALRGQTPNSITITLGGKSWSFTLAPSVQALACDKTVLGIGESSTCTVTLDSPALAGGFTVIPYSAGLPLVLNPPSLTVPMGSTAATFTVTRPAPISSTASPGTGTPK